MFQTGHWPGIFRYGVAVGPDVIVVDIAICREEWLRIYSGDARNVHGYARDGRSVVFPAGILSRWVSYEGVYGSFMITFDGKGKLQAIEKIGDVSLRR